MRKTLFGTIAATIMLANGAFGPCAYAAPLSASAASDAAIASGFVIQRVVNVCGSHGCVPVQTKRVIRRQKPGSVAAHHI